MYHKGSKEEEALMECYRRLYAASDPPGDFDEIVELGKEVDGRKVIPYDAYEIEERVCLDIIDDIVKEYNIPKHNINRFKNSVYLGCSPRFKSYE